MARENGFFDGWSWFKLNNLTLEFYISVEKKLKLELIFLEFTVSNLRGCLFNPLPQPRIRLTN